MTAVTHSLSGASSSQKLDWQAIDWPTVQNEVRRMQMRIAKAIRMKRYGKAKALQRLLTCSFYAKLLAVKRVAGNSGAKTPGVDRVTWKTPKQKMNAVFDLKRRGYQTQPLRRIYIPKRNGKLRPLSIPTMRCRAMQALHKLGLEPIAETLADRHSYGFRPWRSTADANEQCYCALAGKNSAQWILEGDIKSCFDKIDHDWLLANVPMDKVILRKWLKAGYVEGGDLHETMEGTPQGGVISPCLLTLTLRGMEAALMTIRRKPSNYSNKVNLIVYADDFVVTAKSKEMLETQVKPILESFLKERGLTLSGEKTKITHIEEGFDFLGFNVRKYKGKFLSKPSKDRVKGFLANIRDLIKKNRTVKTEVLIQLLNSRISGWANYYRHVAAKDTFSKVDDDIFWTIWRWAKRRHPKKGRRWIRKKYFRTKRFDRWTFFATMLDEDRKPYCLDLVRASGIPIRRHIKIQAEANPFDPKYRAYFADRRTSKRVSGSDPHLIF